jgi:hypothetical protein
MRFWILAAPCLAGCAAAGSQVWYKPGMADVDSSTTLARCHTLASEQPLTPKMGSVPNANDPNSTGLSQPGVSLEDMGNYRRAVNDCMAADGWMRR